MLLNVSIFVWYGAVCPWYSFAHSNVIPIYRLIFMAVLVLLFRRLPIVLAMHKRIHQIEEWRQAFFVGFFGPMGVSAIFYLYTSREFLRQVTYQGQERADAERLAEVFNVVVWFMVISSVVRFPPCSGSLLPSPNPAKPQNSNRLSTASPFPSGRSAITFPARYQAQLPTTPKGRGVPAAANPSPTKRVCLKQGARGGQIQRVT